MSCINPNEIKQSSESTISRFSSFIPFSCISLRRVHNPRAPYYSGGGGGMNDIGGGGGIKLIDMGGGGGAGINSRLGIKLGGGGGGANPGKKIASVSVSGFSNIYIWTKLKWHKPAEKLGGGGGGGGAKWNEFPVGGMGGASANSWWGRSCKDFKI